MEEGPGIHSNFPMPERGIDEDEEQLTPDEEKLAVLLPNASRGEIKKLLQQYGKGKELNNK